MEHFKPGDRVRYTGPEIEFVSGKALKTGQIATINSTEPYITLDTGDGYYTPTLSGPENLERVR